MYLYELIARGTLDESQHIHHHLATGEDAIERYAESMGSTVYGGRTVSIEPMSRAAVISFMNSSLCSQDGRDRLLELMEGDRMQYPEAPGYRRIGDMLEIYSQGGLDEMCVAYGVNELELEDYLFRTSGVCLMDCREEEHWKLDFESWFVDSLASDICFNVDNIDWKAVRRQFKELSDSYKFMNDIYIKCLELYPDFDERELGHFLSDNLRVEVPVKSLDGMMHRKWREQLDEFCSDVGHRNLYWSSAKLDWLIRSGFTSGDLEEFRRDFLDVKRGEFPESVVREIEGAFTEDNVKRKEREIMRQSAEAVIDSISEYGVLDGVRGSICDFEVGSIEETMRGSLYKDWLLGMGYHDCAFINEGGSFIAVLNDGRLMSGSNIMIEDALFRAVEDLYEAEQVETGTWDNMICSGLHRFVIGEEGDYIGYQDPEMLNLGAEDDTLTICTPDRFKEMLSHNRQLAEVLREDIDEWIGRYPGFSAHLGELCALPEIDSSRPGDSDFGYSEYGITKVDYSDGLIGSRKTQYFFEEGGEWKPLLPFPVSSLVKRLSDSERKEIERTGAFTTFGSFTILYNGVLTGKVTASDATEVKFGVDLASKNAIFFSEGKEYTQEELRMKFFDKNNGNQIKR